MKKVLLISLLSVQSLYAHPVMMCSRSLGGSHDEQRPLLNMSRETQTQEVRSLRYGRMAGVMALLSMYCAGSTDRDVQRLGLASAACSVGLLGAALCSCGSQSEDGEDIGTELESPV